MVPLGLKHNGSVDKNGLSSGMPTSSTDTNMIESERQPVFTYNFAFGTKD
jgi:hypothetical protein